jgi:hypothetical protein
MIVLGGNLLRLAAKRPAAKRRRANFLMLCAMLLGCSTLNGDEVRRFVTAERVVEGRPVYLDAKHVTVLSRDGRLWDLDRSVIPSSQAVAGPFRSLGQGELRAALFAEFGVGFEISGTGHYLVVHPAGQRSQWAQRFEDLYRQMLRYYAVRGIRIMLVPRGCPRVGISWDTTIRIVIGSTCSM